jgi:hypothetical protein
VIDPAGVLFREKLCHFLAMKTLVKGDGVVYCIGSRTGIPVRADEEGGAAAGSTSAARGLHHLCCRARARADVDVIHRFLIDEVGARIVHPPEDAPHFAPGYYSVLFEDSRSRNRSISFRFQAIDEFRRQEASIGQKPKRSGQGSPAMD